jgi:hypothetical protein
MFIRFTSIIATVALLTATVNASGQIAQVVDANDFCVFLPPNDATDRIISNSEWNANAFCMGNTPQATGADKIPSGFIKSAHYVKTDAYVQVTGQIDYTKANLVGSDGGGQMDVRAPMGSSCAGWKYYVNLIEPTTNTYCMRCCNDTVNCNRGISEKGCAHIIPGDYSGPNDGTGSGLPAGSSTTTTTTAAAPAKTSSSAAGTKSAAKSTSSNAAPSSSQHSESNASASSAGKANASGSAPIQAVSAQSINTSGASSSKPMAVAVGAGLLISAAILA